MEKRVINLVNFIRGASTPESSHKDLAKTLAEEIKINQQYGFPNTHLMQYDAMRRNDLVSLIKDNRNDQMELGVWLELCEELVESIGLKWRGREGYTWDWHFNPGFLPAYTRPQREALIDAIFQLFYELFGDYPKVAGCWMLDAYSMDYMNRKYGMKAYCICREQDSIDAYTLWGGYYSGGYYPSKNNALCPAQTAAEQINVPVFRMLGGDPIYAYDPNADIRPEIGGCYTLEPCWSCGQNDQIIDWYFKTYFKNPCLSHSELTTGQENSFEWENKVEIGYPKQAEKIKEYVEKGWLAIETLGDTGVSYQKAFGKTPPAALCALEDWNGTGRKSLWYSCRNYRADLFADKERLFFRDIFKFDERYYESYTEIPADSWCGKVDNLPVIDQLSWSNDAETASISFDRPIETLSVAESGNDLHVSVVFRDGTVGKVIFSEDRITLNDTGALTFHTAGSDAEIQLSGNSLSFLHNGFRYSVGLGASVTQRGTDYMIQPQNGVITVEMNLR